jgi:hypothetical protein
MNIALVILVIWVIGAGVTIAFIQGASKNTIKDIDKLFEDKVKEL